MNAFTIRTKLILSFAATILIPVIIVSVATYLDIHKTAEETFISSTDRTLEQVDTAMTIFMNQTRLNVNMLADNPVLMQIDDSLISHVHTTEKIHIDPIEAGGLNARLHRLFKEMHDAHPAYDEVYLGTRYGGWASSLPNPMPAGYDPRKRGWYQEAAGKSEAAISSAYMSTYGYPVVSIGRCVKGTHQETLGVVAFDIALKSLTDMINNMKIGETGYAILIQQDGTILANARYPDMNFKKISEVEDTGLHVFSTMASGHAEVKVNGKDYVSTVYTSPELGWKMAALIEKAEVVQGARAAVYKMASIGLVVLVIFLLLAVLLANSIAGPVRNIAAQMSDGSEQVASASQQVSSSSQLLADGASEQASSVEQISSSLEEMSSMTRQNADNASEGHEVSKKSLEIVTDAESSMTALADSIHEVADASEQTQKIVKTIDEIAFQTNLLALNAAVEAARAGDAGAGFAVVAEEVRNLAMRSAEAAKNTEELIENTVNKVHTGTALVESTTAKFRQVMDISGKLGELTAEIAAASKEQAQGIEQVNQAVTEMDRVIQQNAANAEESASASEELSSQSESMKDMVNRLTRLVESKRKNTKAANVAPGASSSDLTKMSFSPRGGMDNPQRMLS